MKTSKFIPHNSAIGAMLKKGENTALDHYKKRVDKCGTQIVKYDFNRGFEYGIQWALDNLAWLEKYKECSHYEHHHPLNYEKLYEKLFDPEGEPRGDK